MVAYLYDWSVFYIWVYLNLDNFIQGAYKYPHFTFIVCYMDKTIPTL